MINSIFSWAVIVSTALILINVFIRNIEPISVQCIKQKSFALFVGFAAAITLVQELIQHDFEREASCLLILAIGGWCARDSYRLIKRWRRRGAA